MTIDLCTPEGRLDPRARGFSPFDRLRANLSGNRLRKKRWNYWCASSEEAFFAVTIADVDYLGLVVVSLLDVATNTWTEIARPYRVDLPDRVRADIAVVRGGLAVAIRERGDVTTLEVDHRELSASLAIDRRSESLNVVIPWSDRRFQLTCKAVALPVRGEVAFTKSRRRYTFDHACLDYGRGVWPYRTHWQWASAARGDVGFNLGGSWTRGSGMTENALFVGGRLHYIGEELDLDFDSQGIPRRFRNGRVDLAFTPQLSRAPGLDLGVLGAQLRWGYGWFDGRIARGERLGLDDVLIQRMRGWSEDLRARW
ncbi:MAG: DUF2804 domain-containing protein [Polyangiales bacterium]